MTTATKEHRDGPYCHLEGDVLLVASLDLFKYIVEEPAQILELVVAISLHHRLLVLNTRDRGNQRHDQLLLVVKDPEFRLNPTNVMRANFRL